MEGPATKLLSAASVAAALLAAAPALGDAGAAGHGHGGAAHGATASDGGPGRPEEASRTVRIEARDTVFNVKQIQVRPGETIRFVVTNKGELDHEFTIAAAGEQAAHRAMMAQMPDMKHDEPNMVTLKPGETKELVWKFGRAADLEFACNISGHAEQGMKGAFRVLK